MAVAVAVLIVGSVLFHLLSPWHSTPLASNWSSIDNAVTVTFWVTGAVFVASIRSWSMRDPLRPPKRRPGDLRARERQARETPDSVDHGGHRDVAGAGPLCLGQIRDHPGQRVNRRAVGQQWEWSFRFPGKDGVLGTADARFVNENNPFGLNPNDPYERTMC